MKQTETISHEGVVESIAQGLVRVRIVQRSACSICKAASHCGASESKEKVVDVYDACATQYKVGERVTVTATMSMGFLAVALGFGVPLVVMLAVIAAIVLAGGAQQTAALAGVGALVPYYYILYLMRHRLSRTLTFRICRP